MGKLILGSTLVVDVFPAACYNYNITPRRDKAQRRNGRTLEVLLVSYSSFGYQYSVDISADKPGLPYRLAFHSEEWTSYYYFDCQLKAKEYAEDLAFFLL